MRDALDGVAGIYGARIVVVDGSRNAPGTRTNGVTGLFSVAHVAIGTAGADRDGLVADPEARFARIGGARVIVVQLGCRTRLTAAGAGAGLDAIAGVAI